MIAEVTFNLVSGQDKGIVYKFNTENKNLKRGDVIVVDSQGKHQLANFVGYTNNTKYKPTKSVVRKATLEEIKEYWKKAEEHLLNKSLELSEEAYQYYCNTFLKNESTSLDEAKKKLTRNVILSSNFGKGKPKVFSRRHLFHYGTMEIRVKGNKIVHIKKNDQAKKFTKNKRKYHYLNDHYDLVGK